MNKGMEEGGMMFESLRDVLALFALGASVVSGYMSIRSRAEKAEIKGEFSEMLSQRTKQIYDRLETENDKIETNIKAFMELKSHHVEEIKKQTNEIENFVMGEIKVLKTQIHERDLRSDKLEKKIDEFGEKMQAQFTQLSERIMDIRELIIGIAK